MILFRKLGGIADLIPENCATDSYRGDAFILRTSIPSESHFSLRSWFEARGAIVRPPALRSS